MEADRFDALARSLGSAGSRRGFLKRLAAGALAGMLGVVAGAPGAEAATCKVGRCEKRL